MGKSVGIIRAGRFTGKLTPLAVRRLSRPGLHADGNGLYLHISPGGGRSWLLMVHVHGRRRDVGTPLANIDEVARPILDVLWQAFGLTHCFEYASDGRFRDR